MIDPTKEDLISFPEAGQTLPPRGGQRVSVKTWYRWSSRGCRGIVLESIQAAGRRITSRQAVKRFLLALTEARTAGSTLPAASRSTSPAARKAAADLDEAGI